MRTALIELSSPCLLRRSPQDRLAFAVHSFFLASGYRTIAVGKKALETIGEQTPVLDLQHCAYNSGLVVVFCLRRAPLSHRPSGLELPL